MGLYHKEYETLTNYTVVIKKVSKAGEPFECAGLLNEDSLSFDFGVELTGFTNEINALKEGPNQLLSNAGGKLGKALSIAKEVGNIANMREQIAPTQANTIKRPKGWSNPSLSFSMTFYEGLVVSGIRTEKYSKFLKCIAGEMLPEITAGSMESNQISWATLAKGMGAQLTSGLNPTTINWDTTTMGFSIRLGRFFSSPGGWWMSKAPVTTPVIFDKDGTPVIWRVSFTFEYFQQISNKEFQGWLV